MGTPEEKEKLVDAIKLFYDNVMEQKDIRHFFFGMTTDKLVNDIKSFISMFEMKRVRRGKFLKGLTTVQPKTIFSVKLSPLQDGSMVRIRSVNYHRKICLDLSLLSLPFWG